jgi:2-C-methyl-D-erythritol 4-phosphate cytidylyltransferase / 2-C-methyl-D-erythritol 2,4-cyclodiphosphate synthase
MAGIYALIVAGGQGLRFSTQLPKQYWSLGGVSILRRTLQAFSGHPSLSGIQVVIHPDHQALYDEAVRGLSLLPVVMGDSHRQGSVYQGLKALQSYEPDMVLIHDGARPFVSDKIINDVIQGTTTHQACIPVVPIIDTLKVCDSGLIQRTSPRHGLYGAQTPQGFNYGVIFDVHHRLKDLTDFTDDASMVESLNIPVATCEGSIDNFKITTGEDYQRGKKMSVDIRVGNGFDVHGFTAGPGLWLCGTFIPCGMALNGHSDADVALHALTDALLGAIGAQDIGYHFPPSDPQWRGASSAQFVKHALKLITDKGGRVNHVDLTIIGEEPRLTPHRSSMIKSLSEILSLGEEKVSLKATTTERLGFTGRKEGLAAMATATVIIEG